MPEILEVEEARRLIETQALGREIARVDAPDAWFLKRGLTPTGVRRALKGRTLTTARRRGKQLLLDTEGPWRRRLGRSSPQEPELATATSGPVLGLHLGMSGRVLIDGSEAGDPLIYASNRHVPEWVRFGLRFADGGALALRDPRRLGAVELDPDEDRLGPDALTLTLRQLGPVLARSRAPVKAVLMDQSRVAGLGNLLVDEALFRAGLDPARPAESLDADDRRRLHRAVRDTVRVLGRRGGSHTGDNPRDLDVPCPRDGAAMVRRTVGGRTTYSCPVHQR